MKKYLLLFFITTSTLSAQVYKLEDLWLLAATQNPDIQLLENDYQSTVISNKTMDGIYAPGVLIKVESEFPEDISENGNIPDSVTSLIQTNFPVPGSASIGLNTSYTTMRIKNINDWELIQTPAVGVSFSQGLYPFWIQGVTQDPYKTTAQLNSSIAKLNVASAKQQAIDTITELYIRLRSIVRQIKTLEQSIALQEKQIESLYALNKQGAIELSRIIDTENSKWNDEQSVFELRSSLVELQESLRDLCGISLTSDEQLEAVINQDLSTISYNAISAITGTTGMPEKIILELQRQQIVAQSIIRKQNAAPVLSLSITGNWQLESVPSNKLLKAWNDDSIFNWTLSAVVDLSNFIFNLITQGEKKEQLQYSSIAEKTAALEAKNHADIKRFEAYIENLLIQEQRLTQLCNDIEKLKNDVQTLYKTGQRTELELESMEVQYISRYTALENTRDTIWYYTWLKNTHRY